MSKQRRSPPPPSSPRWTLPPAGEPYFYDLMAASTTYNLPPLLLARVAWQESRFVPSAISPAGAQGIMQIVPKWHPGVDPFEPSEAIPYAASYLEKLFKQFGSWDKALAAYNWGPGNLSKAIREHGPAWLNYAPGETQRYVRDITTDIGLV